MLLLNNVITMKTVFGHLNKAEIKAYNKYQMKILKLHKWKLEMFHWQLTKINIILSWSTIIKTKIKNKALLKNLSK